MQQSKYLYVFDAGHGGMKNGKYTTAPSKMKVFPDGLTIYEGVVNRAIAAKVSSKLYILGVDHAFVHDDVEDISLNDRCRRINDLVAKEMRKVVSISLHSDAFEDEAAHGSTIYTSPGVDQSDSVANVFANEWLTSFPEFALRVDKTDGDLDKEAKFQMVLPKYNKAEARILLEHLFFTNRREAEFLLSIDGQQRIAEYICRAIIKIENTLTL